jgi:RNA polymerase sigma-70 factor (ECF subfamily)
MSLLMSVVSAVYLEHSETEMSDAMLVSMAKSGDANAFVELSKRHADQVYQSTYRVTRNEQDAEDALQDSFLRAFTHIKTFEERSSFSTWLTRIAINSALMILRKKRNSSEISIDCSDGPSGNFETWEPRSPWEDPESRYVRRERQRLLAQAIHRLPPVLRDVVELRQVRECSNQEIAQSLGISLSAVKSRMSRAKDALRMSMVHANSQNVS